MIHRNHLLFSFLLMLLVFLSGCNSPTLPNAPETPTAKTAPVVLSATENSGMHGTFSALSEIPEDYPFDLAVNRGDVVNRHGEFSNLDAFEKFVAAVESKNPAFMRFVAYTIEGDPILADVDFDGACFIVTFDISRDAFAGSQEKIMCYRYDAYTLTDTHGLTLSTPSSEQRLLQIETPEFFKLPIGK